MPETNTSDVNLSDNSNSVENTDNQVDVQQSDEKQIEQQANSQQQPPKSSKRNFKIKVDGKEEDFELDLDNEDELRKMAQMSKAAQKRMSEAAKAQKQAEQFIQKLKTNPRAVLEDPNLGMDFRKIAEEYLYEQIQRESMTPEEIKYHEDMKRLAEFERQQQEREEQQKNDNLQKQQQYWAEQYDKTITEALTKSNLPKTSTTVKRMAQLISKNLELGLDLSPSDLVEEVRNSYMSELKELVGSSEAETILALFGDDVANKIRKHDISRLKLPANKSANNQVETVESPKSSKGYMTPDEYKEWLDKRVK